MSSSFQLAPIEVQVFGPFGRSIAKTRPHGPDKYGVRRERIVKRIACFRKAITMVNCLAWDPISVAFSQALANDQVVHHAGILGGCPFKGRLQSRNPYDRHRQCRIRRRSWRGEFRGSIMGGASGVENGGKESEAAVNQLFCEDFHNLTNTTHYASWNRCQEILRQRKQIFIDSSALGVPLY